MRVVIGELLEEIEHGARIVAGRLQIARAHVVRLLLELALVLQRRPLCVAAEASAPTAGWTMLSSVPSSAA